MSNPIYSDHSQSSADPGPRHKPVQGASMNDNITAEQARKLLEQDEQARSNAAAQQIQAVLAEHNCQLIAMPQITADGRVVATAQIVARRP